MGEPPAAHARRGHDPRTRRLVEDLEEPARLESHDVRQYVGSVIASDAHEDRTIEAWEK